MTASSFNKFKRETDNSLKNLERAVGSKNGLTEFDQTITGFNIENENSYYFATNSDDDSLLYWLRPFELRLDNGRIAYSEPGLTCVISGSGYNGTEMWDIPLRQIQSLILSETPDPPLDVVGAPSDIDLPFSSATALYFNNDSSSAEWAINNPRIELFNDQPAIICEDFNDKTLILPLHHLTYVAYVNDGFVE